MMSTTASSATTTTGRVILKLRLLILISLILTITEHEYYVSASAAFLCNTNGIIIQRGQRTRGSDACGNVGINQAASITSTTSTFGMKKYVALTRKISTATSTKLSSSTTSSNTMMKGSGQNPIRDPKKIAIIGGGGYLGGLIYGFLQRCASLSYVTGISSSLSSPRCIGATADTSVRLNRFLSRNFCLAYADERYVKLTNLMDPMDLSNQFRGYDAIVFGIDNLFFQSRIITGNTYEKSPNDKTWEIYWGSPKGSFYETGDEKLISGKIREEILLNVIAGAKLDGTIQHIFVTVGTDNVKAMENDVCWNTLKQCNIPCTCICTSSDTYVKDTPSYTYQSGVQDANLMIKYVNGDSDDGSSASALLPICLEDLAALSVQCIQSLDWTTSRMISVSASSSTTTSTTDDNNNSQTTTAPKLRVDQQWCVNSYILQDKLTNIR